MSRDPVRIANFAATGVGSYPGTDVREAARIVAGELSDFVHLPELPLRGPGADMIGRCGSALTSISTDFAMETTTDGWRLTGSLSGRVPRVMRRGLSWLHEDLDGCEEAFAGYQGSCKIQLAGPLTMAAAVELPTGEPVLADVGATRDLVDAVIEAAIWLSAEVVRRIPGARPVIQFDEPSVGRVIAGRVPSQSGLRAVNVDPAVINQLLARLASSIDIAPVGVHCCDRQVPVAELTRAKFGFISLDISLQSTLVETLRRRYEHDLAAFVDAGGVLLAGLDTAQPDPRIALAPLLDWASRTGVVLEDVSDQVGVTPTCGLAGLDSLGQAQRRLAHLGQIRRQLAGDSR